MSKRWILESLTCLALFAGLPGESYASSFVFNVSQQVDVYAGPTLPSTEYPGYPIFVSGNQPYHFLKDPKFATRPFVYGNDAITGDVYFFSPPNDPPGQTIQPVRLGCSASSQMSLDPGKNTLYVPCSVYGTPAAASVERLDLTTTPPSVMPSIDLPSAQGTDQIFSLGVTGTHVVVGVRDANLLTHLRIWNKTTQVWEASVDLAIFPYSIQAHPSADRVYVLGGDSGKVVTVRWSKGTRYTSTLSLGTGLGSLRGTFISAGGANGSKLILNNNAGSATNAAVVLDTSKDAAPTILCKATTTSGLTRLSGEMKADPVDSFQAYGVQAFLPYVQLVQARYVGGTQCLSQVGTWSFPYVYGNLEVTP
jgi:hypothetical protein